jgi:hypothetical protein
MSTIGTHAPGGYCVHNRSKFTPDEDIALIALVEDLGGRA